MGSSIDRPHTKGPDKGLSARQILMRAIARRGGGPPSGKPFGKPKGGGKPVRPGDLSRLRDPRVRRFIEGISRQQHEFRAQGGDWQQRPNQNPLAAQMRAVRDALERQKSKPGQPKGQEPFTGVGGGGLVGAGGKPGKPAPARPAGPTPAEIFTFNATANRNRLENIDVGDPGNVPGSGGAAAEFPGSAQDWLTRAMELEGLNPNDPTLRPLYEEGTRQEGAANKYQGGYSDVNTGGNEAFGPAQIIPATFEAWADPRFRNRYNPVHNLLAMIRGTKNKYGSYEAGARVYARPGGYG